MATGSGQNLGSILFGALGQGVSAIPGGLAQERQQTLQNILTAMDARRQIIAEQEHKQNMQLGALKIQDANLNLIEKTRNVFSTRQEQLDFKLNELKQTAQVLQGFSAQVEPGLNLDLGGGIGISRANEPSAGRPTDLQFAYSTFGPDVALGMVQNKGGGDKTLSAKDQELKTQIFNTYPEAIATRRWNWQLSGENPSKDAKTNYDKYIGQNTERGLIGGKVATPEVKAKAAQRSGWSPIYGGTKQDILDGLAAKYKAGQIPDRDGNVLPQEQQKAQYEQYVQDAKQHFANLYSEVLEDINAGL